MDRNNSKLATYNTIMLNIYIFLCKYLVVSSRSDQYERGSLNQKDQTLLNRFFDWKLEIVSEGEDWRVDWTFQFDVSLPWHPQPHPSRTPFASLIPGVSGWWCDNVMCCTDNICRFSVGGIIYDCAVIQDWSPPKSLDTVNIFHPTCSLGKTNN